MISLKDQLNRYAALTADFIEKNTAYKEDCLYKSVIDAMQYSALAGGKRIRPAILLEFYSILGGNVQDALPFAAALEMIHTYSLIHDDLPCMDDDDMRRGRPSCHIAYGESTALLAGDGLLTLAFSVAAKAKNIPTDRIAKAIAVLADCAGIHGMIGGQVIDLESENKSIDLPTLQAMHALKTGALIRAAALIGCVLAGATEQQKQAAEEYALKIGLAFQFFDDILDATGDATLLGKPIGSDAQEQKSTSVSILGVEATRTQALQWTDEAISALNAFENKGVLVELANYLTNRKN